MTEPEAPKTVSDVIPPGEGMDLPETKFEKSEIEGEQVFILDCIGPQTGKHGEFMAVIVNRDTEGEGFFFMSSGLVMEKLTTLKTEGHLPILGTFAKQPTKDGTKEYWNLL